MKNSVKYSVVLPIFNVEKYLKKGIDSVLQQTTISEFEIILVDDGSPDTSGAICDEYAAGDSRIKVIHQQNKGVSAARNAGIKSAEGEYVIFLDPDDYWEPCLLTTLDRLLETQPDIALFSYSRVDEAENKQPFIIEHLPNGESGEKYLSYLLEHDKLPLPFVWSYAYRRNLLLDNSLYFNENMCISEDFDLIMRSLPLAKSVVGTTDAIYGYLIREGSLTASISQKKIIDNLICKSEFFRRYPSSTLANNYAWFIVGTKRSINYKYKEVLNILKQNKDIFDYVTHPTLKLAIKLFRMFGFVCGLRVFWLLADFKALFKRR